MAEAIAFRKKIVINLDRPVSEQVGKAQRGQWLYMSGMNARVVNRPSKGIVVERYDLKAGERQLLQFH